MTDHLLNVWAVFLDVWWLFALVVGGGSLLSLAVSHHERNMHRCPTCSTLYPINDKENDR